MMISLPSKWIKANSLGKGDEIDVNELGKDLLIKKSKELNGKNKAAIDVTGYSPLINRILIALYQRGIDELEVRFSEKKEIIDFQKKVINELLGFEIMKQSQGYILLKEISGSENQDIDEIIKRIIFILDAMMEELVDALENDKDLEPIIETDSSINKFVHFCLRLLNKRGYKNPNFTSQIYGLVSELENMGDICKRMAKDFKKIKPTKEYIQIIKETREQLRLIKGIIFDYNKNNLLKFAKNHKLIKERIKKMKNKTLIDFHLFAMNEAEVKLNNYVLPLISF